LVVTIIRTPIDIRICARYQRLTLDTTETKIF
jgi:hypothetical protein